MWTDLTRQIIGLASVLYLITVPVSLSAQDLSFDPKADIYLWPTDASPYLSSTFGETRSAHFHSGLDIRTWGQEGYRVFATKAGSIHRLQIGPDGYGKVIYLQHNDGSFSVYAHLNRFSSQLQALADSIRMNGYNFELNKSFEPGEFTVGQGDIIGYTGSTGVGPPHLHFELRTPDNIPFNPLLTNLDVSDTIPPVFSGLAVEHLNSSLQSEDIETYRPTYQNGVYNFGTIQADRALGLSVNVYDRANNTPNAYAVYNLTMTHDGDTLFHSKTDYFSFFDDSQMFIDRVYPLLRQQQGAFQRLFVLNGNQLPFYQILHQQGVIDWPEEQYEIRIIAADIYGNRSTASLVLDIQNRNQPVQSDIISVPAYPAADSNSPITEWKPFRSLTRRTIHPAQFHAPEIITVPGPTKPKPNSDTAYIHRNETSTQLKKTLVPGTDHHIVLPDYSVWFNIPADALFDTLEFSVTVENTTEGLPSIRFTPEYIPLNNSIEIGVFLRNQSPSDQGLGLYGYNNITGRYIYLNSENGRQLFRTTVSGLHPILVMSDRQAPDVRRPFVRQTSGNHYVVIVPVNDEESGINYHQSNVLVNGNRAITEYDREEDELIYYDPGFQPLSENLVEVDVVDHAGNRTMESYRITR